MNNIENRPVIELLPQLNKKCRLLVTLLHLAFIIVPMLLAFWAGMQLGWLYGLLIWILSIFAGEIVLSKIKVIFIPADQHELSHSTTAILKWFVAEKYCN